MTTPSAPSFVCPGCGDSMPLIYAGARRIGHRAPDRRGRCAECEAAELAEQSIRLEHRHHFRGQQLPLEVD